MAKEDNNLLPKKVFVEDPAEYLFSNSRYHDCHLKVGNPETEQVETIGVSALHLIAHSPVFRGILADSILADPSGSNTCIKDVSPATFKLMLRYVYGCKLPEMTFEEAANLAFCADKYDIQRLMEKAAKRLKPTTAEDVFPAFMCVVYINCPDLELCVRRIIQQQTDKIVKNPKFLHLDENCLLFLVKQGILNIGELELWNNLVRWGENQVKKYPNKTVLRNCLKKILQHVRLLSLTSNEILEHVLPTNILTQEEFMDLSLAVSKKQTVQSPGLCKLKEKREIYKIYVKGISSVYYSDRRHYTSAHIWFEVEQLESKPYSALTIKCKVNIEINTLTLNSNKNNPSNGQNFKPFTFTSFISVYKLSKGHLISTETMTITSTVVPIDNIVLQVKKHNGESLILEAKETYSFQIEMSPPFPVYKLYCNNHGKGDRTTRWHTSNHFEIKFEDPFHVLEIGYTY